jgi:hypothetical protein
VIDRPVVPLLRTFGVCLMRSIGLLVSAMTGQ